MADSCEWCGGPCPAWSAMCETCAAPLGGLPDPPKIDGYLILEDGMPLRDIDMAEVGRSIQLIGAVYADEGSAWAVLLPGVEMREGDEPRPVTLTIDEWNDFLRQTDLVELEALVAGAGENGKPGKAIVRKSARQVAKHTSWVVFRRDGFACRYCGADEVPLTVDHLVTWEDGGPSIEANLVTSCSKCNNARGTTPFADWLMSGYYKRVSAGLGYEEKFANQALVPTLADIPITPLKPGKKKRGRR